MFRESKLSWNMVRVLIHENRTCWCCERVGLPWWIFPNVQIERSRL